MKKGVHFSWVQPNRINFVYFYLRFHPGLRNVVSVHLESTGVMENRGRGHALKKAAKSKSLREKKKNLQADSSSFYCVSFKSGTKLISADNLNRIWKSNSLAWWWHMLFIKLCPWQVQLLTFTTCDCLTLPPLVFRWWTWEVGHFLRKSDFYLFQLSQMRGLIPLTCPDIYIGIWKYIAEHISCHIKRDLFYGGNCFWVAEVPGCIHCCFHNEL